MSEGDWIKTLLLFFDDVAILLPRYMHGRHSDSDPVTAGPLEELGLLRILHPEFFLDLEMTESLAEVMTELITSGAFDDLDRGGYYHALSQSRVGWNSDIGLARMLIDELKERDLARDSEDGVSVPLHPVVRMTILVVLSQLARSAGKRQGLDLHPTTNDPRVVGSLVQTLSLEQLPSAGNIVALDLEAVSLNLETVPLDEVLDFRKQHQKVHRDYMRNVRRVIVELSLLSKEEREQVILDRREELADQADDLRRLARKSWRIPLASFSLGGVGAAWEISQGNFPAAVVALGSGVLGAIGRPSQDGAYSYLFQAQRSIGDKHTTGYF